MYWEPEIEQLPPARLQQLQLERLRKTINRAALLPAAVRCCRRRC